MPYPGGKNGAGVYQQIINLMPPHEVYIEPFLGSGAIMRMKRPAALNIGIDRDSAVIQTASLAMPGREYRFDTRNALRFLESYQFTGRELVYCDPPYVHSTRTKKRIYKFEMNDAEHHCLLDILRDVRANVMISGYDCSLYREMLSAWHCHTFMASTRGGPRQEYLWCNFTPSAARHDYSYLGSDFRERERIKRKKHRWIERLKRIDASERAALLDAIAEVWNSSPQPLQPRRK